MCELLCELLCEAGLRVGSGGEIDTYSYYFVDGEFRVRDSWYALSGGMVVTKQVMKWRVILAAVIAAGAAEMAYAAPAQPSATLGGGRATAESWPMFRGGPGLTGISPANLPNTLSLLWTYKTGGPVKSSPAISGGKVFIGSDDKALHCIDLKSGTQVWKVVTEGEIESSPLVLDGMVYAPAADGQKYGAVVYVGSADGALYAVNAKDGKTVWSFKTENKILGAPNWVHGPDGPDGKSKWVLAGSYDYKLYCFDAATGKTNWTYETGNYINGTPAVAEGKTVFGGCDALLHVISLKDGQKIKEVEAGAYIAGSGAYEANRFYVGHYENEFLCADLEAGEIKWKFKDRAFPYFSSPALTKEVVVFGGRDKKLHCVRKDSGAAVWEFPTRGKVDSSPVVAGAPGQEKVVVGSEDGNVYMVSLAGGKEIWSYEIGQAITSSPAVVNGMVVVGSEDGNVYAFGTKGK
jgi:outer membrane protein assembly factor BamB